MTSLDICFAATRSGFIHTWANAIFYSLSLCVNWVNEIGKKIVTVILKTHNPFALCYAEKLFYV